MTTKNITLLLVLFAILVLSQDLYAQCAMCKATVNENVVSGKGKGQGLNTGILYLMAFPYIIGSVIAFFWYKAYKKNKQAQLS
jgi:hypothetical protein